MGIPDKRIPEMDADNQLNILIVDDSEDTRMMLEAMLKGQNRVIDTAENGILGFERFKQKPYDLVLLDMAMPLMDGLTATQQIRNWESLKKRKKTCIFICSAYPLKAGVDRADFEGLWDAYLLKPVKQDKLLQAVKDCLPDRYSALFSVSEKA